MPRVRYASGAGWFGLALGLAAAACSSTKSFKTVDDGEAGGAAGADGDGSSSAGGTRSSGSGGTRSGGASGGEASSSGGSGGANESGGTSAESSSTGGTGGNDTTTGSGGDTTTGSGGDTTTGSGGDTTTGSGGDTTTSSGGGGPTCTGDHFCSPSVPGAWSGPVTFSVSTSSAMPVDCRGEYPTSLLLTHTGLSTPNATCDCQCVRGTAQCQLFGEESGGPLSGACGAHAVDDDVLYAAFSQNCTAMPTQNIPAADFDSEVRVCGGATTTNDCGAGQRCTPTPASPFSAVCIFQSGDHECPTEYPDKQLFHDSVNDNRSCSTCSCQRQGGSCELSVEGCGLNNDDKTLSSSSGNTVSVNGDDTDYQLVSVSSINQGQCNPSSSTLQGSVTTSGATTLCCLE